MTEIKDIILKTTKLVFFKMLNTKEVNAIKKKNFFCTYNTERYY